MATELALVLHAHQPVGNFDHVIEEAYQQSYRPFLAAAARRVWFRCTLHYSGFLLDWLAQRHPEYLDQLRELLAAGQIELLGGGYYEPILAAIPAAHQQEQLRRLADTLERHFGLRPQGGWLAERVWEPNLASVLARAGLRYTLLDDAHFERSGIAADDLHGYWLTEDQGESLAVVPSNYFLRQAIPFQPVEASLEHLEQHAGQWLTMGDDLEKFGSWPHTHQHCYGDGWLERFFDVLEARQDAIRTVRVGEALAGRRARGLIYLPSGSYPEMMAWAGSPNWRGFFSKYPEANLLHKTVEDLAAHPQAGCALEPLLAAEANDVYWHGWFGGLYSPHLRNVAFTHLLQADALLNAAAPRPPLRRWDLLRDGSEAVELRSPLLRVLVDVERGAVIELDVLPRHANLVNTIARRPEPYHENLLAHAATNPAKLPGGAAVPGRELEALLVYDTELPGGYAVARAEPGRLELGRAGQRKMFTLDGDTLRVQGGAECDHIWCFNLLAPDAEDRYFIHAGQRFLLRHAGELGPGPLTLVDGWRRLRLELTASEATGWSVRPRYTVSQSETGFEAIYQGSDIQARGPAALPSFFSQAKIFLD